MREERKEEAHDPRDERIRGYRGDSMSADVAGRVFKAEFHWARHVASRERGEAELAEGYLRTSVRATVGLAAHPTQNREDAERKVAFLTLSIVRMGKQVGGDAHLDHVGAIHMLAAAASEEARQWGLGRPTPGGGESRVGNVDREPGPALRRSLRRDAVPRSLAETLADIETVYADCMSSDEQGDGPAAIGAVGHLRAALLHSLAIPATSTEELDLKLWAIEEFWLFLQPHELTRPMLDAVLLADGLRFGRAVDLGSLLE